MSVIGQSIIGRELEPLDWSWGPSEVMLYALGVGAAPARDLPLVFEGAGPVVLPTFATVPTGIGFMPMVAELDLDLGSVLHGEQSIALDRPLPAAGVATVRRRIVDVWDKGGGAVLVIEDAAADADGSLFTARSSWFVAGAGGFGGERGPSASSVPPPPDREPDFSRTRRIRAEQAALYRLSGDRNPIHVDPASARAVGFDDTFIHGLCTFGMVGLELLMEVGDGRPEAISAASGRFVSPVRSGDELTIELWRAPDGNVRTQARVGDRLVLSGGWATVAA